MGQRGQGSHRQRGDDEAKRELVKRGGVSHVRHAVVAGENGQIVANPDGHLVYQQPHHNRRIQNEDAAHGGMSPVKLEFETAVAQGGQLQNNLQKRAKQQAVHQTFNPVRPQQSDDDDRAVENGGGEGGQGESFQGIKHPGENAGNRQKEDGRRGQAHHLHRNGR